MVPVMTRDSPGLIVRGSLVDLATLRASASTIPDAFLWPGALAIMAGDVWMGRRTDA
jgi:hypothetical protein